MKQIKLIVTIISAFPFMLSAQGPGGPGGPPPTDPLTALLDKNEDCLLYTSPSPRDS